jgi:hypothetical protein
MAHRILTSLVGIDATFSSTLSLTSLAGVGNRMLIVDSAGTVSTQAIPTGTVTSVGLSMPSAFTVTNSPVTGAGTLTVTGAGTTAQYVRGDGTLANFPTSTGGGSSFNYYLNGSISQGTFGGNTYYQMSRTPILGAGTNFTRTNGQGNGYIASFITDAGDPSLLNIPGGNWNLEFYFQSSASGGGPQFYGEIYKVSAANVFTLVASGSANPEGITNGTTVDQYFTSIPVPQTSLLITDRIAIRIYVITSGRTITLHTENGNLCEVLTTFSTGLTALNGLTAQVQYLAVGTSGTDFNISSVTDTHTFNLPTASATNRGALSSADWTTFNNKQDALTNPITGTGTANYLPKFTGSTALGNSLVYDDGTFVGIGTTSPSYKLDVNGTGRFTGTTNQITAYYDASNYMQLQHNSISVANTALLFNVNSAERMRLLSTGNLLIGTTTDSGYKLDVNGTARINSTLSLTNSSFAGTFNFYLSAANTMLASSANIGTWLQVGGGNNVYIVGQTFNSTARGNNFGNTVGGEAISATTIIAQSSGTTATTGLSLRYTINNTGSYSGISRGIYYNPTLTSLTGTTHRAIETTTGDVLFGTTSGVVAIGTTTLSTEANLYLGAKGTTEGGQLILQKGTSQTYATHLDNYSDQFRVMYGTDTGSSGIALAVSMSTRQLILPAYTTTSSFSGTVVGYLAFDSSGNVLTVAAPGGSVNSVSGGTGVTVSPTTGNVVVSIGQSVATSATPSFDQVFATNNGNGTNFKVGDDAWIGDVNTADTLMVMGQQNAANGYIIFGNSNFTALGRSGTGALTYGGYTIYHSNNSNTITALGTITTGVWNGTAITDTYISSASTWNAKQNALTLTTTGTSGAATLVGATLNIPQYQSVLTNPVTGTGTTNYLSKWTSSSTLNTSLVYDDGTNVGIGTTTFLGKFQVGSGSATQFQVASSGASIYVGPSSGNYNMNITTNTIQSSNSGTTNTYLYIQPNGSGNVAMCSSGTNKVLIGTTTDAGFKLDVNGTTRSQGKLTITTGGAEITGNVVAYTGIQSYGQVQIFSAAAFQMFNGANNSKASFQYINANGLLLTTNSDNISGVLKGLQVNPTTVASANNDTLVGLDISPTFTAGAFTGVTTLGLRVQSGVSSFGGNVIMNGNNFYLGGNLGNTVIRTISTTNVQIFNNNSGATLFLDANGSVQIGQSSATNWALFSASGHTIYNSTNTYFFSTGNIGINQSSDAGYKLDVNGTARVQTTLTVGSTGNSGTINLARASTGGTAGAIIQTNDITQFYNYQGSGIDFYVAGASTVTRAFVRTTGIGITGTSGGNFTMDASAALQINSTIQGFLPPRMTVAQRTSISTPATGLVVYQTDSVEGLYVYTSSGWKALTMV